MYFILDISNTNVMTSFQVFMQNIHMPIHESTRTYIYNIIYEYVLVVIEIQPVLIAGGYAYKL